MRLPAPGDEVILRTPGGARHPARVIPGEAPALGLSVDGLPRPVAGAATLEYVDRRGILELEGRLEADGDGGRASFRPQGRPFVLQRRAAVRVDLLAPARQPAAAGAGSGHVLDLSATGFLLSGRFALRVGQVTRFRIELPDGGPPLEVTGEVRRDAGPGQWGVRMTELAPREQERIVRLLFARQRLALRTVRQP